MAVTGVVLAAGLTVLTALATPVTASAATPVSPPNGATVVGFVHPLLRWSLAPNEGASAVETATSPFTTASGFSGKVVALATLSSNTTQWSPGTFLFAGTYYWHVQTHDPSFFIFGWSPVSSFTVPVVLEVVSVKSSASRAYRSLTFRVGYVADVTPLVFRVQVFQRGRRVGAKSRAQTLALPTDTGSEFLTWVVPRKIKRGARLTVVPTVSGASSSATGDSVTVKAP